MKLGTYWVVAATLVTAGVLWTGTGRSTPDGATTLQAIESSPSNWVGVRVRIAGRLMAFHNPDGSVYGAIQSGGTHRIGIRHLRAWEKLVGRRVWAVGTVEFDPAFGWYLSHPQLTPAVPGHKTEQIGGG